MSVDKIEDTLNGGYGGLYGEVVTEDCYRLKDLTFVPDVIFDFGANVGVFTRYAREMFPNALIISVEPHADNYENLLKFTDATNIIFINKAIGDGKVCRINNDINGAHESYINYDMKQFTQSDWIYSSAESVMPHELISKYLKAGQKSFLKLDIEGNENKIFADKNSMEAISKIDCISMELHFLAQHWTDEDRKKALEELDKLNKTHHCEKGGVSICTPNLEEYFTMYFANKK